jgi:hypothetical protein
MFATKQLTLTTAGVVYPLGTQTFNNGILVKALSTNTGIVYIGNDGADTISTTTGFPLDAGNMLVFYNIGNLATIFCIGTVNLDKIAILDLEV